MKTTDGSELRKGHYYYLENGQCVCLEDFAETPTGEQRFVVIPFFEGEAMGCSGDGREHYEYEGEPMLVSAIFEKAPTEKLCSKYKQRLKEIEKLALSAGLLQKTINGLMVKQREEDRLTIAAQKRLVTETIMLTGVKKQVEAVEAELSAKRQQLSELEDSIATRHHADVNTVISTAELQRLNKREYELDCLEHGGVDNWEWYSESLEDYHERYPEG